MYYLTIPRCQCAPILFSIVANSPNTRHLIYVCKPRSNITAQCEIFEQIEGSLP